MGAERLPWVWDYDFSDDLDLFVNDDDRFGLWAERLIQTLTQAGAWQIAVLLRQERFFSA